MSDNEVLKIVSAYATRERVIVNWDILEEGKQVEQTCSRFSGDNMNIFLKQTGVQPNRVDSLVGKIFVGRTYTTRHDDVIYIEPASLRPYVKLSNPALPKVPTLPAKVVEAAKPVPPPAPAVAPVMAVKPKKYDKSVEHNARVGVDYLTSAKLKIDRLIQLNVLSNADLQTLISLSEKLSKIYNEQCDLKANSK